MVAQGCKRTNFVSIPEDWNLLSIPEVISKKDGMKIGPFGSQLKKELLVESGYKVYGQENVYEKDLEIGERFITKEHFDALKSCELHPNDFIISMMGTIGKCLIVPKNIQKGIMDSHLLRLRLNSKIISADLLLHFFSSKRILDQVFQLSVGGIMNGLSSSIIKSIQIPVPSSLKEQTAIATALSDTNALIENLGQLIIKKRNIKQGAMQELLKPKTSWIKYKIADVADVVGGGTPSTFNLKYWNGEINWFTPTEIGDIKYTYHSNRKITKDGLQNSSARLLPVGTILLTSRASIGDISILMVEGCTNQGFQSLIAKRGFYNEYLYYLVLTLKPLLIQNASGSTFLEISPGKVKAIEIYIPDYKMQYQIAKILSDMDSEIQILEQKLHKYRMIKQGMMQVLLTGKIRLI
jgi:type I restriction enzyme, S subunit